MFKKIGFLLALQTLSACSATTQTPTHPPDVASTKAPLVKVSLALNWFPEAEHAGYLTAKALDYGKDAGIDLEIIPGGPDAPVIQRVASGDVAFGIANADEVLIARAQQVPIVALMAPIQHAPTCVLVHKDSGISKLSDLKNVTLAITQSAPYFLYLQKKFPLTDVKIVPYSGNVANFLSDKNFAQQGYVFSEPFTIKEKGGESTCLSLKETGFDPYTSVLITSESYLNDHEDQVRAMVRSSVAGWNKYIGAPRSTNDYIKSVNPQMNDAILKYGHETLRPMILADAAAAQGAGAMRLERWQKLLDQLVEIGVIKAQTIKAEDAFTTKFLSSR